MLYRKGILDSGQWPKLIDINYIWKAKEVPQSMDADFKDSKRKIMMVTKNSNKLEFVFLQKTDVSPFYVVRKIKMFLNEISY